MTNSPYYDAKFLASQQEALLALKEQILNKLSSTGLEDFCASPDQVVEDGDQAQAYLTQNVSAGLREREIGRLREIELALHRLENGTYGICEETDAPIGKRRLEKMPWARLSIQAAEELERESETYFRKAS